MGWICIDQACEGHVLNGQWDGTGNAFYSIADDISILHVQLFAYLQAVAPSTIVFGIFILVLIFVIALFTSVRLVMLRAAR